MKVLWRYIVKNKKNYPVSIVLRMIERSKFTKQFMSEAAEVVFRK